MPAMTIALRQPMTVAGLFEREERRETGTQQRGVEDRGHASTASGLRTVMLKQAGTGGTLLERAGDDRIGPVLTAAPAWRTRAKIGSADRNGPGPPGWPGRIMAADDRCPFGRRCRTPWS